MIDRSGLNRHQKYLISSQLLILMPCPFRTLIRNEGPNDGTLCYGYQVPPPPFFAVEFSLYMDVPIPSINAPYSILYSTQNPTAILPFYTFNYLLGLYEVISYAQTIAIYQLLSVTTKGNILPSLHLPLFIHSLSTKPFPSICLLPYHYTTTNTLSHTMTTSQLLSVAGQ